MSSTTNIALAPPKSLPVLNYVRAPLLGLVWVLFNALVVALGIKMHLSIACSIFAGAVDGAIVAVIVVAVASEKFQAGTAGLLSAYGLQNMSAGFAPLKNVAKTFHHTVIDTLFTDGLYHEQIDEAVLWIAVTALLVVLAALVVQ